MGPFAYVGAHCAFLQSFWKTTIKAYGIYSNRGQIVLYKMHLEVSLYATVVYDSFSLYLFACQISIITEIRFFFGYYSFFPIFSRQRREEDYFLSRGASIMITMVTVQRVMLVILIFCICAFFFLFF